MDALPVIDVGPLVGPADHAAVARVADEIDRACRSTGFFLVTGHGVPREDLDRLDAAARAFFALPDPVKARIAMAHGGRAWRGWFPEGGELTAGRPDHKEGLYLGEHLGPDDARVRRALPLHGANLYPDEVPELGPAVERWVAAMTDLGHALARGVSVALGLDPGWIDQHLTAEPTLLFRIFRYPPRPPADDGWGVAEHTDYGLLTILAHDGTPALQVRGPDGWIDVPAVPDAFVVNLGDVLDRMTGGRYRSTPHRVRHTGEGAGLGRDRLSFPFFFDPGWDAEIVPVPLPGEPPADDADHRWDGESVHGWSGTYGERLTSRVARVFPELGETALP
ncbi:MAG TPA: 2-oxoglutarate and iron-dependent oxygenase domain-containing protein [Aquihabitans sp.]|nr:2-oxoglutarate and iron-dependent oxygenase domain-containing protein [Aquihabitans sp.]